MTRPGQWLRAGRAGGVGEALGAAAVLLVMAYALNVVRVGGPLYRQIDREKNLVNDLTPPALFLRGPQVLLTNLLAETDPALSLIHI